MISLHVTLYTTDEGDRFKVMKVGEQGDLVDVTSDYEVAAVKTEDGRVGLTVVPLEEKARLEAEEHEGGEKEPFEPAYSEEP